MWNPAVVVTLVHPSHRGLGDVPKTLGNGVPLVLISVKDRADLFCLF